MNSLCLQGLCSVDQMVMDKSLSFSTSVILQSLFFFLNNDLCFMFNYLLLKKREIFLYWLWDLNFIKDQRNILLNLPENIGKETSRWLDPASKTASFRTSHTKAKSWICICIPKLFWYRGLIGKWHFMLSLWYSSSSCKDCCPVTCAAWLLGDCGLWFLVCCKPSLFPGKRDWFVNWNLN